MAVSGKLWALFLDVLLIRALLFWDPYSTCRLLETPTYELTSLLWEGMVTLTKA